MNYDVLWQLSQKEKQSNELQFLPKNFYDEIKALLHTYDKKDITEEEADMKKNILKLLNELFERRKQKILIYVAYKKQMPQPAINTELDFYNNVSELANKNRIDPQVTKSNKPELRSLQAMPEIILPSGKKIGPFGKDQLLEMSMDDEDIKFLINNTICKRV